MKLTKLFLTLTAFTALIVVSNTAGAAGPKNGTFTVTTNVSNNCTIDTSAANIVFGAYDPVTGAAVTGSGTVKIACTKGATGLSLALSGGANFATPDNQMASGSERLKYDLYSDSTLKTPWNNTSVTVPAPTSNASQSFTIYGQIKASQDVAVGTYTDTVTATINY